MTKPYWQKYREKYPWLINYNGACSRCNNPKNPMYKFYGKKGIKLLMSRKDFEYLWRRDNASLMEQPSIDRIDTTGNYTLENCRYVEMKVNRKRNNLDNCIICGKITAARNLCQSHYKKLWKQENKEHIRNYDTKWRENHREELRIRNREYEKKRRKI